MEYYENETNACRPLLPYGLDVGGKAGRARAQPRSAQQEGNSTSAAGSRPSPAEPSLRVAALVMSQTTCSPHPAYLA